MRLLHGGAKYKITGAEVVPRIKPTFATHYNSGSVKQPTQAQWEHPRKWEKKGHR